MYGTNKHTTTNAKQYLKSTINMNKNNKNKNNCNMNMDKSNIKNKRKIVPGIETGARQAGRRVRTRGFKQQQTKH